MRKRKPAPYTKKPPEEVSAIRRQVGRLGGLATKEKHGHEHYVKAGTLGAIVTNKKKRKPEDAALATEPQATEPAQSEAAQPGETESGSDER